MVSSGWLNLAWLLSCLPESKAFRRATRQVAATQANLLLDLVRRNRCTQFGRQYRFDRMRGTDDFQRQVPLTTFDDFQPFVRRIADGQSEVLTREPVRLLEPTSGTTRGEKLIPYTATLRRQFQRGLAAWMADLLANRPGLRSGRAYWSISPACSAPRRTDGGIAIGFDDDAAYLGRVEQAVVRRLLVSPPGVRQMADLDVFRYATLLSLLRAEDLTLISIWNPTFLTSLLDGLPPWHDRLCQDVRDGGFRPPTSTQERDMPGSASLLAGRKAVAGQARRADMLADLLREAGDPRDKVARLWPNLQLISCWTDAAAARDAAMLRRRCDGVELQGKGLLATEACVSIPLLAEAAPALALRSAFFEFQPSDAGSDTSACRLAHQLDVAGCYRVVVTTGGGLYRYQLRDVVRVEGFLGSCPLLRFLGKADCVSDLVGEKLSETHVRHVLEAVFSRLGIDPGFTLLVPMTGAPSGYRLYLQTVEDPDLGDRIAIRRTADKIADDVEAGLRENPHYRYAVGLRQLAPLEVVWLAADAEPGWQTYQRGCLERGQAVGNIKPAALDVRLGWPETFAGSRALGRSFERER